MRPEATALIDQADAATAHAAGVMQALAEQDNGKVLYVLPGPVLTAIAEKLRQRLLSQDFGLCPHLSWTAPQPAFWLPWAPGALRCVHCNAAKGRAIRGTREDNKCDGCRRCSAKIHCDTVQLPALVADLPPLRPGCFPPLIIMFGLCPACQEKDLAGITEVTQ